MLDFFAAHTSGNSNGEAYLHSRKLDDATEWQLYTTIFKNINETFRIPKLNLFASKTIALLPHFVSWHPEPMAWATGIFPLSGNKSFFVFPPFSLVVAKIIREEKNVILTVPTGNIADVEPSTGIAVHPLSEYIDEYMLNFLGNLFEKRNSYSAIVSAKCVYGVYNLNLLYQRSVLFRMWVLYLDSSRIVV